MAGTIVNGQPPEADSFMNAYGSNFNDTAQMIFNADYLGFDSRLDNSGVPNLKNIDYSTFTADVAATKTNFDYDATNDLYTGTTGQTTATLITEINTSTTTITNAISTINDLNLKSHQNEILEASFETDVNWTYSELDADNRWSGSIVADPHTGTNSYQIVRASGFSNIGNFGQVQQTGIDLSNSDKIGIWRKASGITGGGGFSLQIIIDATSISLTNLGGDGSGFDFFSGDIPIGLQTTGKSITIKFEQTGGDTVSTAVNTFDDINIWNSTTEDTKIYSLSADGGSNFEVFTPTEIHRFTSTGTQIQLKIVHSQTNGTFTGAQSVNYVSEFANKHNFY